MNELEIAHLISKDPFIDFHYRGSFAADNVPTLSSRKQQFAIVNLSPQGTDGSHWTCFYSSNFVLECFDPLGSRENVESILLQSPALLRDIKRVKLSQEAYQEPASSSCALFCIYFITKRLFRMQYSFESVLSNFFSSDTARNEQRVQTFLVELEDFVKFKAQATRAALQTDS